jgi:hypothetical protein
MPEESSSKVDDGGTGTTQKETGKAGKKTGHAGQQAKGFAPSAPKFEGKCTDIKGHIYDRSDIRQSDRKKLQIGLMCCRGTHDKGLNPHSKILPTRG